MNLAQQKFIPVAASSSEKQLNAELGLTDDLLSSCSLPRHSEPKVVAVVDASIFQERDGRTRLVTLAPEAAAAWALMKTAAMADNVQLNAESGFRSADHQANIIRSSLNNGKPIEEILTRVAPPYRSEHNAGIGVDIANNSSLIHDLGTRFDETQTFKWLEQNAARFGFYLSYPKDNDLGITYEPWHWCYKGPDATPA